MLRTKRKGCADKRVWVITTFEDFVWDAVANASGAGSGSVLVEMYVVM